MYTLAAAIVLCLAIAGQVQCYPHSKDEKIQAQIQRTQDILLMKQLEKAHVQDNMVCNSWNIHEDYEAETVTEDRLKAMLNVFTHQSNNIKTYIYVPERETGTRERVFASTGGTSGDNHAEDNMYYGMRPNLPGEYWSTNTPCPYCAKTLIQRYQNKLRTLKQNENILIHATHFYTREPHGRAEKEQAIECMALMIQNKFRFVSWDWEAFSKSFLPAPWCSSLVKSAIANYGNNLRDEIAAFEVARQTAEIYATEKRPSELCR